MVRDLGEFGKPDVVINTRKLDYVHKRDLTIKMQALKHSESEIEENALKLVTACGGALLEFQFKKSDREKWEQCFEFFKKCIHENDA